MRVLQSHATVASIGMLVLSHVITLASFCDPYVEFVGKYLQSYPTFLGVINRVATFIKSHDHLNEVLQCIGIIFITGELALVLYYILKVATHSVQKLLQFLMILAVLVLVLLVISAINDSQQAFSYINNITTHIKNYTHDYKQGATVL